MSFFGRIFSHMVQDAAVQRLAQSKTFQRFAVKTVDTVEAAQKHLETAAKQAAEDPHGTARAVQENAASFWGHLKSQIARDLEKLGGDGAAGGGPNRAKR
jgi:DNA integrity scanning protein DisA with diadenylate cyclase activity